jgi:sulfoxide reductase heme-binding subunit YedZ
MTTAGDVADRISLDTDAPAAPDVASGSTPSSKPKPKPSGGRAAPRSPLVWVFRAFLLVPFVFTAPEIGSVVLGRPHSVLNLSTSAADVFGTSAFIFFAMMLAVTPVHTMTGWKWHRVLRRDFGIGMFAVAATDLTCAATVTGNTFPGGFLTRIGGHTFLLAGTLSTLLLVPLVLTANRRAQRWLGPHWKWVHRIVYVLWVTILIHLAFLFAFRGLFIDALLISLPLAILRIPAVRQWWVSSRKARTYRSARWISAVVLIGIFAAGYVPFVSELANVGVGAFVLHPPG